MDFVNWLFFDLNAYFASVEQQEHPELRGKPVIVVPVMTDSTCCIAASYEAKKFGIKTGTNVGEAKALCPGLILVEARHGAYVRYHHAIVDVVNSCVPVETVLSIDEMNARLTGSQRQVPEAIALAQKIKKTLARQVGPYVKASIGLAPNRFLAKVAGDMQKPDGLTVILPSELPERLYPLKLRDLPGIGRQMEKHLHERGILTMPQLCQLEKTAMHQLWGGVVGERFYAWLRGEETLEPPTHRHTIGHSHVLEPAMRSMTGAYTIAKQLVNKAAVRLRRSGYWASGMYLAVRFLGGNDWAVRMKLDEAQDTPTFLKTLDRLWDDAPAGKPVWVGLGFHPLVPIHQHTLPLFANPKQEKLSAVMDQINERYGRDTTFFAALHKSIDRAPTRIAFTQIPDLSEVDG